MESAYAHCLAHKLRLAAIPFKRQVDLPIYFEGLRIESGYRIDFVVDDIVLVELKSVERSPEERPEKSVECRGASKRVPFP